MKTLNYFAASLAALVTLGVGYYLYLQYSALWVCLLFAIPAGFTVGYWSYNFRSEVLTSLPEALQRADLMRRIYAIGDAIGFTLRALHLLAGCIVSEGVCKWRHQQPYFFKVCDLLVSIAGLLFVTVCNEEVVPNLNVWIPHNGTTVISLILIMFILNTGIFTALRFLPTDTEAISQYRVLEYIMGMAILFGVYFVGWIAYTSNHFGIVIILLPMLSFGMMLIATLVIPLGARHFHKAIMYEAAEKRCLTDVAAMGLNQKVDRMILKMGTNTGAYRLIEPTFGWVVLWFIEGFVLAPIVAMFWTGKQVVRMIVALYNCVIYLVQLIHSEERLTCATWGTISGVLSINTLYVFKPQLAWFEVVLVFVVTAAFAAAITRMVWQLTQQWKQKKPRFVTDS